MAYNNRSRNNNSKGGNTNTNNNYHVTTKADVQFYNRNLEEVDNSTLSISFWKGNIMFTIHPAFTQDELKGLEKDDKRVFNYDVNMTIALPAKQAYKLYKGIQQLEAFIRAGKTNVKSVAVKTTSKVIKVGLGDEYGLDGVWYLAIFASDSEDGLFYFFNNNTEEDEVIFNYNEETLKGSKKVINTELEIVKEILREVPLMLSSGYAHETRQELSRLRTFIEKKLENGGGASSSRTSRSGGISNRRRRPTGSTSEEIETTQELDFDTTFDPSEFDEPSNTPERSLDDIADLESDFLLDDEE